MPATSSPTLFDQFARGWRGYVLIGLIALLSAMFGAFRTPVWDVDEARFAQATRQMVETGDYVRIRLQDAERNKKPIGVHWAQAASVQAFEPVTGRLNTIWPYRLPSVLGLVLAALATLWGGTALLGQRTAILGAGLFAAGMLAGFEGMTAKTDALLLGFTTLALAALARMRQTSAGKAHALLFWFAIGCAVLIKGPVAPLIALLTLGALALWERHWDWMRPLLWWPAPLLALAIVAPWVVAITRATDGRFLAQMVFGDIAPKILSADNDHFGLPGYHLLLLAVLIFPATYALPGAARLALGALRDKPDADAHAPHRFLLAWIAPAFLLFELLPTKLPHYVLPTYPAIALLCGAGLSAMRGKRWRTAHPAGLAIFVVAGLALVALTAAGATFMPGNFDADLRRAIAAALIGTTTIGAALAGLIMLRRPAARAGVLIACALALSFSLRERLIPEARTLFVSDEAVATLTRARLLPQSSRALWVVGYNAPSIVFLTRTSTKLASPSEAGAGALIGDALVVEGRVLDQTQAALSPRGLRFAIAAPPARGFALDGGGRVALFVGSVAASAETEGVRQQNP